MINLLKNEYIKVFKKKGFLILIIIMAAFVLLTNVIYKSIDKLIDVGDNDPYIEEEYREAKKQYETNKMDKENRDWYLSSKDRYDTYQLTKTYGNDSWQAYYIDHNTELSSYIDTINSYELGFSKDKELYENAKEQYNSIIKKLENSDWKVIVNDEKKQLEDELKKINEAIERKSKIETLENDDSKIDYEINEIESLDSLDLMSLEELVQNKKSLEINIDILKIQLEKNISYSDSVKYANLMAYQGSRIQLLQYEDKKIDKLQDEEKEMYYEIRKNYFTYKYIIEDNDSSQSVTLANIFEGFYEEYLLMIVLFIFLVSGPIVSQEFSKGTIKLLLVKPYSRTKILLSKYLVVLSSILMAIGIMFILQLVIGGLMLGFSSMSDKVVVYSSIKDSAQYIPILKYFALITIAKLPHFIILATLTFAASAIFNNTAVSIITGFAGYIGTNILTMLLVNLQDKPLTKFFIGFNWDFKNYILDLKPELKGISFGFSVMVCLIYFLILIVPTFIIFKRKDIKNI